MTEFRPPLRSALARRILAALLLTLVVIPMLGLVYFLSGHLEITYQISDGRLKIESGDRMSGSRVTDLDRITEARRVSLQGGRRTMGTALGGYCAGNFAYDNLGPVWQATDCGRDAVVLRAAAFDKPVVITPPDPAAFLQRLQAHEETFVALPPPDKTHVFILSAVVVPIALVTGVVVVLLLLVGPSRMVYRVGAGTLEVATMFSRKRWPTSGMKARRHRPGRMLKVMGSSAPGYYTGRFREAGESLHVYATDLKDVVIVECDRRLLLSPEHPEAFLDALERAGASVQR